MQTLEQALLVALAVYGVTYPIVNLSGPFNIFAKLRDKLLRDHAIKAENRLTAVALERLWEKPEPGKPCGTCGQHFQEPGFLLGLISCQLCLSAWAVLPSLLILQRQPVILLPFVAYGLLCAFSTLRGGR